MTTLDTIQKLARLGRTFCKIIVTCCIVGACLCGVGLVLLPTVGLDCFRLGGVTIYGLLDAAPLTGQWVVTGSLAGWLITSICEGALAKFAQHYFDRELADGTPFTASGAALLQKLGVKAIVIPILCGVVLGILEGEIDGLSFEYDPNGTVAMGLMFLLVSLLCRYGAEIPDQN